MRIKLFSLFIAAMLVVGLWQYRIDSKTPVLQKKKVFVTLPPGKTIKVLSFGFQDVVADMLFIWSIQFYSNYHYTNSFEYLEHVYDTITDVAPHYKEPYIVGSWIMALEANDIEMAIRLLEKGSRNNQDDWIYDYECGSWTSQKLKQYERAEAYYHRATEKPGAPSALKRKEAHMIYMRDDLDTAYKMWMEIYQNATSKIEEDAAYKHLFQIKFEKDKAFLEDKLKKYKEKYGRYPDSLSQLVKARLIREVPLDFQQKDYFYTPGSDTISASHVLNWKQ